MKALCPTLSFLLIVLMSSHALAWGATGHRYVGAIADRLLRDNAREEVQEILGYDLRTASTWADCVRSVYKSGSRFEYREDPAHPEYTAPCTAFNTPAETARMEDYVRRNWFTCMHIPGHGCHETYHFTNVDKQNDGYDRAYAGTSDHDIVSAINAAILVLQDKPTPAPFSIKDEKEAILLLAHFVGDLHQPLHVSSVYLSADGDIIDPDRSGANVASSQTRGGNAIRVGSSNLHSQWDAIPQSLGSVPSTSILNAARAVPATDLPPGELASAWATDTIMVSHMAFDGVSYSADGNRQWSAMFENRADYLAMKARLQTQQLPKAGARLAEILNAIWP